MWKICFNDSDEFMDFYFSKKYKHENTLIYFEDNKALASLQMLPYCFTFCGVEIPISYISGACTLPEYRGRGYMGKLLLSAFDSMRQRKIPLSILIPAEKWLYDYYARYGYEAVFEADNNEIPLKKIIDQSNGCIDAAYTAFDALYRNRDFCVQKTKEDFAAIVKEAESSNFSPKSNIAGMARIINAEKLLSCFADKYPEKSFVFENNDDLLPANNGIYKIDKKLCKKNETAKDSLFSVNETALCRLLFGFHLEELPKKASQHFERHNPCMNLMLE